MPDLSSRSAEIEMMDDLNASGQIIDVTLRELETINLLLGGNHVTIDGIKTLIRKTPKPSYKIADVGCGSGDILRLIARKIKGPALSLVGIDANENIVNYARAHTPKELPITFEALDIFSDDFRSRKFDIVTGTLFFHHFTHAQLASFFSQLMKQVSVGIVINDIHRHWFAYYSIKWLTKVFSKSPMVVNDAPLSVRRAFTKQELISILHAAGIERYTLRWMWAFRWQVLISV